VDFNWKERKIYAHATWESVAAYNQTVCGAYRNVADIKKDQVFNIFEELIVGVSDLISFHIFSHWLTAVSGDIELRF
jgi:hypothetical protein